MNIGKMSCAKKNKIKCKKVSESTVVEVIINKLK